MGTKISEATLRENLKGSESLPIVDSDLPKGRTTTQILKDYCATPIGEAEGTAFDGARGKAVEDIVNNIVGIEYPKVVTRVSFNDIFGDDTKNLRVDYVVPETGGEGKWNIQFKTATTSWAGLMSKEDKQKLDSMINVKDYTIYIDTYNKDSIVLDADTAAKIKSNETLMYIIDGGLIYYVYLSIINDYYIIFHTFGVGTSSAPTKDIVVETRIFQFEKSTNTLTWYDERMIKLTIDSDGTKFLSDDGTYKAIEIPDISNLATKNELNAKVSTETYNADKATFATKTELNAKVSGTGVTQMQVVTALPESQEDGVLYIVTGKEA